MLVDKRMGDTYIRLSAGGIGSLSRIGRARLRSSRPILTASDARGDYLTVSMPQTKEQDLHTITRAESSASLEGSINIVVGASLSGAITDAVLEVDLGADAGHVAARAAQVLSEVNHVAQAHFLEQSASIIAVVLIIFVRDDKER